MHDQADELRLLARRGPAAAPSTARPPLVVVSSGKGGVGATTVAVNLAVCLSLAGRRTLLVDADLNRANATHYCGLVDGPCLADWLSTRASLHEIVQRGPGGVLVLAGPWSRGRLAECSAIAQEQLLSELAAMGAHADLVVIDAGAGLNRVVRRYWREADCLLPVVTPDPVGLLDTYATLKVYLGAGNAATVLGVVNQAADAAGAAEAAGRLARTARRFLGLDIAPAPWLPLEPQVRAANAQGRPVVLAARERPVTAAFEALADQVAATLAPRQAWPMVALPVAAVAELAVARWGDPPPVPGSQTARAG